jgi:hypothetical protein
MNEEKKTMSISSVKLNNVDFGPGSEPTLTEGVSSPNNYTINGSGFSGNQVKGDITFNFTGETSAASSITSQSTTQISGTFVYQGLGLEGGVTQTNLAVTVTTGGVSTSYPGSGTYPVKIN